MRSMPKTNGMVRSLVMVALAAMPKAQALAAGDVFDQFYRFVEKEHRVYFEGMPEERVDPFSGNLTLVQTDLVLPGKAGLDLKIQRTYSSKIWGRTDGLDYEPLLAEKETTTLGYGWQMHMGRIRDPNAIGQGTCSKAYPLLELPDGSARVFYPTGTANVYLSRDYWRMETSCSLLGGAGACVWSNEGIRYEFSSANQYFYGGTTLMWPASAIVDSTRQNRITIAYSQGYITSITDSYGRVVTFSYSPAIGQAAGADGRRLDMMDANGNVYRYSYYTYTGADTGGPGTIPVPLSRRFLKDVTPPAGRAWSYEYGQSLPVAQNQYALSAITTPHGGSIRYTYKTQPFYDGASTVPFAVVGTRTEVDRGGATLGTWTYDYVVPAAASGAMNVTTITLPGGARDVHTMYGFASVTGANQVWRVGLTKTISRANGAEVEDLTWNARSATPVATNVVYTAPAYSVCAGSQLFVDTQVYAPVVERRVLQRDGTSYTTSFSSFDAYGQAQTVTETGQQTRTTAWTFLAQPTDAGGTLNLVRGRPTSQRVTVGSESFTNSWTYDGPGFAKTSESRSGVATTFTYHTADPEGAGNIRTLTNAEGKVLTLTQYSTGNCSSGCGTPRRLDFNGVFAFTRTVTWEGWILSQTDGRSNTTNWTYDAIGRMRTMTPPGTGETVTYVPDDATGSKVDAKRGTTYTKTTFVDGFGRETGTSDTLGIQTSRKHDALGRTWFRSAPFDAASGEAGEKLAFDGLGRVTGLSKGCRGATTPASACTSTAALSTVAYDYQAGNCVQTTEQRKPDSIVTTRCYTSFGDPDERRLRSVTDGAGKPWSFTQTAAGNLSTVTAPDAAGNRSYDYDSRQYRTGDKSRELGTVPGDTVSLRYGVNGLGQITSRRDARNVSWTLDYTDGLSRLRGITYGSGSADNMTQTYQPGSNNVATVSSTNGGLLEYPTYDEVNRLRLQRWTFTSGGVATTYATTYTYDARGCLTGIGYPTGSTVVQTCDAANRVTSITLNGTAVVTNVTYHPSGAPRTITYANGKATTYGYDDRARAETITVSPAGVMNLSYGYDGLDNVVSYENLSVPGTRRFTDSGSLKGYDKLNRLITVYAPSQPWGTAGYDYDSIGNRTLKVFGASFKTDFTYDAATNRLDTIHGNIALTPMTFTWDLAGRLASSSDGTTYRYDGLGRRAEKQEPAQATIYHYDPSGRILAETQPGGARLRDFVYLGNRLVAVEGCIPAGPPAVCNERNWYHTDALGTVVARTDSGTGVWQYDYQPWGEPVVVTPPAGDRLYNGRVADAGTGLYDYGARMYSPELGRFLSADTVDFDPDEVATGNRYAYVFNNPYKFTDPNGRVPFLAITAVGGAIIGAGAGAIISYMVDRKVTWQAVVGGALAGAAVGLGSGAAVAYFTTGSATASSASVYYTLMGIGSTGVVGEKALERLGGQAQVYFKTTLGGRYIDQLVRGVAHEAKVGYQSLTKDIAAQIAKDIELLKTGQIQQAVWHFFRSPVTNQIGPSAPLRAELVKAGIQVIEHQ